MERFFSHVQPQVPGCSAAWINRALLMAAVEFCEDTLICKESISATAASGSKKIVAFPPANTRILSVDRVDIPGVSIEETSLDKGRVTFALAAPATKEVTGKVFVTLAPNRSAKALPDLLHDNYFEAILSGAFARLMEMQKRNWTDQRMAVIHQKKFLHSKEQAKLMENRKNFPTMTVRQRPWV